MLGYNCFMNRTTKKYICVSVRREVEPMKRKITAYCVLLLICISSCAEYDPNIVIMVVGDQKVSCKGGQSECYLVQTGDQIGTDVWESFPNEIEGFSYEPGSIYTLQVDKKEFHNPLTNNAETKYVMIKELSRVIID